MPEYERTKAMINQTLAQAIASAVTARANCRASGNKEWLERWTDRIESLVRDHMPSGSGIDCGTKIDLERSNEHALRFSFSFHHMDEHGYYNGWTEHQLVVKPAFQGLSLHITGPDRNQVKEYLYEVYSQALSETAPELTA
jgi:hypothetical protein